MPEGSGLGFEDLIGRLEPQVNALATVSIMPLEDIAKVLTESSGDMLGKLEESGKVNDVEALKASIKHLVIHTALQLVSLLLAPVALIAALIFVCRYGRNQQPRARGRKRGKAHAV